MNKPGFIIIGAQKAGTTWLWTQLEQHPDTDLPARKEIHYFGSAELYRKGKEWYYDHFAHLDESRVIGEASTTYLFDNVPYWHNSSPEIKIDESLPTIPELITSELPNVKIIVTLRDPVRRAISAYYHCIRRNTDLSPWLSLTKTAVDHPKLRILEYGYYSRYLAAWMRFVPPERMLVFFFEEDIVGSPETTLRRLYQFLDLDPEFKLPDHRKPIHKSWTWNRIILNHYAPPLLRKIIRSRAGKVLDTFDPGWRPPITDDDMQYLRSIYRPEMRQLESLLGRRIACWKDTTPKGESSLTA